MVDIERPSLADGDGGSPSKRARLMAGADGTTENSVKRLGSHHTVGTSIVPPEELACQRVGKSAGNPSTNASTAGQMDIRRFFKQGSSNAEVRETYTIDMSSVNFLSSFLKIVHLSTRVFSVVL